MPKSGSGEPEGQPAQQPFRNGRRKNQPAEGNLRIGACRKAEAMSPKGNPPNGNSEAVSPKANPPRAPPNRCVPKSESSEPEGQPAEWKNQPAQRPLRSGACRKAETGARRSTRRAATPKRRMPKSGSREPEGQPPSGSPNRSGNPERRKPPKTSVRHPQVEAAKRGVGGAVPTHLPIQSKNAIVTPRGPPRHHKKCFIIRNQALPRVGKKQKKSRKSLSQLGNKSRKAPNSSTDSRKTSKSCEFSPSPPLVGSPGGRVGSDCNGYTTAVSPHAGARESNSPPPVRRFGTKRRFLLSVSTKMPTFAAAIPRSPQLGRVRRACSPPPRRRSHIP